MKILVGIITYKRHDILLACLQKTREVLESLELSVSYAFVSNDLDPTLIDKLDNNADCHVIMPDQNIGVAGGRNLIIHYARDKNEFDFILFIDDDAYLNKIPNFQELNKSAIYACNSVDADGNIREQDLPPGLCFKDRSNFENIQVGTFIGVCHIFGSHVFNSCDYDEITLYGFEEFNLSFKAQILDFDIFATPKLEVTHLKDPRGRIDARAVAEARLKSKLVLARTFLPFGVRLINISSNVLLAAFRGVSINKIIKIIASSIPNGNPISTDKRKSLIKKLRRVNFPLYR